MLIISAGNGSFLSVHSCLPSPMLCLTCRNPMFFKLKSLSPHPWPNHQAGGPPLVDCPLLLFQYIFIYAPYPESLSSICNLTTRHAVVTRDRLIISMTTVYRNCGAFLSFYVIHSLPVLAFQVLVVSVPHALTLNCYAFCPQSASIGFVWFWQ
jgi:hypothetical protein